jgi:hypothetical protein
LSTTRRRITFIYSRWTTRAFESSDEDWDSFRAIIAEA